MVGTIELAEDAVDARALGQVHPEGSLAPEADVGDVEDGHLAAELSGQLCGRSSHPGRASNHQDLLGVISKQLGSHGSPPLRCPVQSGRQDRSAVGPGPSCPGRAPPRPRRGGPDMSPPAPAPLWNMPV